MILLIRTNYNIYMNILLALSFSYDLYPIKCFVIKLSTVAIIYNCLEKKSTSVHEIPLYCYSVSHKRCV